MSRKFFKFVLVACIVSSCSLPTYLLDNRLQTNGVDFRSGKWLLNEVNAPSSVEEQIKNAALTDFRYLTNNRSDYIYDVPGLLLPRKIDMNPTASELNTIKLGSGYDYLIGIRAAKTRQDFGPVDLTNHKFNQGGTNTCEVEISIYDLNRAEQIYSQKVIASITRADDNNDVYLSKSSTTLIMNAYKRLAKDITEKSVTLN